MITDNELSDGVLSKIWNSFFQRLWDTGITSLNPVSPFALAFSQPRDQQAHESPDLDHGASPVFVPDVIPIMTYGRAQNSNDEN